MAAANVEPSVAGILEEPLLVVAEAAFEENNLAAVRKAPVLDIGHHRRVLGAGDAIVAEVAAEIDRHRRDHPLLGNIVGILHLRHGLPVGNGIAHGCKHVAAETIDNLIGRRFKG